jgi:hypothetical protein
VVIVRRAFPVDGLSADIRFVMVAADASWPPSIPTPFQRYGYGYYDPTRSNQQISHRYDHGPNLEDVAQWR